MRCTDACNKHELGFSVFDRYFENAPSEQQVQTFETISPLFSAAYNQFQLLIRREPLARVNHVKLIMVNTILETIRGLFHNDAAVEYLTLLNEQQTYPVSDVIFVMAQYRALMHRFVKLYYQQGFGVGTGYWKTKEKIKDEGLSEEELGVLDPELPEKKINPVTLMQALLVIGNPFNKK
ncbi:MAG: hypothetical protein OEZ58_10095 [Gammaproteobacteria bacterium]|nr:hypothetical protein [Gammaproteobacteria bacterium]MDH5729331.1 hypothetical protein [Gammaproteobacteria bacterium]